MPTTDEEKIYQIALSIIPQIGVIHARRLMSYLGTARDIFKSTRSQLLKIPRIGPVLSAAIHQAGLVSQAESIWLDCQREHTKILFYTDLEFPNRLKQIYDSPIVLYWKGNHDLNTEKILAVVGTRKATEYGKRVTSDLVKDSIGQGITFVSGLAYGIDIALHLACLKAKINTVAVLAGGFNWIYPNSHQKYVDEIIEIGGILSEYPVRQKPDARFFPLRNRIIAGMSDATLVVEAAERGGALITADYANNYNREVFAVPGNLDKLFSEGCNLLIQKHKANIYTDWNHLCAQLNWRLSGDIIHRNKNLQWNRYTAEESEVLSLIHKKGEIPLDEIAWQLQKNMGQLATILLNLEFQGILKALPGHRYVIK